MSNEQSSLEETCASFNCQSYDAASPTTSQTLPNGVVTGYSYNDGSYLTGLTCKKGANVLGNLTSVRIRDHPPHDRELE